MSLVLSKTDEQGIVTITLNDPETRNAISDAPMIEALTAAIEAAEVDPKARVVILTGAGKAFSSGGNVKKMGEGGGLNDDLPARTRLNYRNGIQRLPQLFEAMELPVVCAVNGAAIGAGCDLTLMCDVRIAGEHAKFAESFVKLGIVPGDGGAWLLPRAVGWSKACEMALTGDLVDAEEARSIGLVSRVVADADLMAEARAVALRIAANPTHAVRMTKRLLRKAGQQSLSEILETSAAYQALAHATNDHNEAVAAMLEKRSPKFQGN
jgi:enoyl-CoA hydratase/carnithine racemase